MPRKEKTCPYCINKGYLSMLGTVGVRRQLIPCECKHGRQFEKLMREESPPTQTKPSPVDAEASTDNNVAKEV